MYKSLPLHCIAEKMRRLVTDTHARTHIPVEVFFINRSRKRDGGDGKLDGRGMLKFGGREVEQGSEKTGEEGEL